MMYGALSFAGSPFASGAVAIGPAPVIVYTSAPAGDGFTPHQSAGSRPDNIQTGQR